MVLTRIDDWTALAGIHAMVRQDSLVVCQGQVDDVTPDGEVLWILPSAGTRRLFEKAAYEVWADLPQDHPALERTEENSLGSLP